MGIRQQRIAELPPDPAAPCDARDLRTPPERGLCGLGPEYQVLVSGKPGVYSASDIAGLDETGRSLQQGSAALAVGSGVILPSPSMRTAPLAGAISPPRHLVVDDAIGNV